MASKSENKHMKSDDITYTHNSTTPTIDSGKLQRKKLGHSGRALRKCYHKPDKKFYYTRLTNQTYYGYTPLLMNTNARATAKVNRGAQGGDRSSGFFIGPNLFCFGFSDFARDSLSESVAGTQLISKGDKLCPIVNHGIIFH
jgi:hypothetical protein